MIWIRLSQTDQPVAVGPKSGPWGLPKDLRGPKKGVYWQKRTLLGAPGVPARSLKGPKHMVVMRLTQLDQPAAVEPKTGPRGPPRTSGAPNRVFRGPNRPFLPVFDHFLELGGSKLAITVLDEQGIPLRCSGHPTSLYLKQKISITKFGRGNLGTGTK